MKLRKLNVFDNIDNNNDILEILDDALADDDPKVFVVALSHLVEKKGVAEVAKLTGLSRESLLAMINGTTEPSFGVVHKILMALNIIPSFRYA